jgi:hypothetical protein
MKALFMIVTFPLWLVMLLIAVPLSVMGNDTMINSLMDLWD